MKYQKPEVMLLTSALKAVQHPADKSVHEAIDSEPALCSLDAYAADE
jgi:hypothetical protein